MKNKLFLLCFALLFFVPVCHAQPPWIGYSDADIGTFDLPITAVVVDSLHTKVYFSNVDSLLGLEVQLFDSAFLNPEDSLMIIALDNERGDSLRAITSLILLSTNSELVYIDDISVNGHAGLDIGIQYLSLGSNQPTLTFMRFFLYDHKFISCSISGSEDDITRLSAYRDQFFNSLTLL